MRRIRGGGLMRRIKGGSDVPHQRGGVWCPTSEGGGLYPHKFGRLLGKTRIHPYGWVAHCGDQNLYPVPKMCAAPRADL